MNAPRTGFATYLKIGRVSNLPTVWTNVLAGAFLSGHAADVPTLLWVMFAITLFYTGGMYLNDAFDADIDARERPNRPIPSGQISAKAVSAIGCAMLMGGILIVAPYGVLAVQAGAALSLAILLYNASLLHNVYRAGYPAALLWYMSMSYSLLSYFGGQRFQVASFDPDWNTQMAFHALIHLSTAYVQYFCVMNR